MKRRWCRARVRSDLPQSALDLRVPRQSSDNGGSTPVQAGLGNSRRSSLVGEEPSMDRDTLSPGPGQAGAIEAGRVLRLSSRPAVYETARLTTQTELVWAFSADLSRNRLLGTARVRHGEIRCGTVRLATCWQRVERGRAGRLGSTPQQAPAARRSAKCRGTFLYGRVLEASTTSGLVY
jgi:hypothetical protein